MLLTLKAANLNLLVQGGQLHRAVPFSKTSLPLDRLPLPLKKEVSHQM
jgi:hypothetical protein